MIRTFLYKLIRKLFFPLLNDSIRSIRIKNLLALYLVETYHFNHYLTFKKERYTDRLDPDKALIEPLAKLLSDEPDFIIKILDVGAGPITRVGYKLENKQIELYPVDALAGIYSKILDKKNIQPPVRTMQGNMEKLCRIYNENEFHLVYANNCIDHTSDPIKAISEIYHVLKPGHYFCFSHFIREGEHNGYHGLHHWDFYCVDNCLMLANKSKKITVNLSEKFKDMFSIEFTIVKRKIEAVIKKIN